MGFTIKKDKKKKSEKIDDSTSILSGAAKRFRRGKEKKARKKEKKKKKRAGLGESDVEDERVMTGTKTGPKHSSSSSYVEGEGIEQILVKDSIEQHRDGFEDSIENHRDKFEDAQVLKLEDWYEQESVAMDLESLKRKPWYQKQKDQEDDLDKVADTHFVKSAPFDHQLVELQLDHQRSKKR